MTSNHSVTTKKYALHFSQQKKDFNEEQKKTAALEQCLREMESTLLSGICPMLPHLANSFPLPANPSISPIFPHNQTPPYHRKLIHF
jgi:hypothetical protein